MNQAVLPHAGTGFATTRQLGLGALSGRRGEILISDGKILVRRNRRHGPDGSPLRHAIQLHGLPCVIRDTLT